MLPAALLQLDKMENVMSGALALAFVFTSFFVFQPASAQGVMGPMWDTYVTLTRADMDMIRSIH